jgi:hypothetical protein
MSNKFECAVLAMQTETPPLDLAPWVTRIEERRDNVRKAIGAPKLRLLSLAAQILSAPRRLGRTTARPEAHGPEQELLLPWFPHWPGLVDKPVYDASELPWTAGLERAADDIRAELFQVCESFERAHYDSRFNEKPWQAYYFYLQGRPVAEHLAACPKTAEALSRIPHNAGHICFSAIPPGGKLDPHTGPMSTSLIAHLGLVDCDQSKLWVAGRPYPYEDNKVLILNDAFVHWVQNDGTRTRYTLMVTFWHPQLNMLEKNLLAYVVRHMKQFGLDTILK